MWLIKENIWLVEARVEAPLEQQHHWMKKLDALMVNPASDG